MTKPNEDPDVAAFDYLGGLAIRLLLIAVICMIALGIVFMGKVFLSLIGVL